MSVPSCHLSDPDMAELFDLERVWLIRTPLTIFREFGQSAFPVAELTHLAGSPRVDCSSAEALVAVKEEIEICKTILHLNY